MKGNHIFDDQCAPNHVVIASPISNRESYLPSYLEHIKKIDYNKSKIHLYFLVNNSKDQSIKILNEFKGNNRNVYASIKIDFYNSKKKINDNRTSNVRIAHTYNHLSECRNRILAYTVKSKASHLLSVDSDIMVPSNIIKKLLSHNREIVSGIIYNGYHRTPGEPWRFPNLMRRFQNGNFEHIANSYVKNAPDLQESKLVEVGLTGAIVLMSQDVCKNTSYGFHHQGEDAYWSIDCANKGYKLFADYSVYADHCMDETLLKRHMEICTICKSLLH